MKVRGAFVFATSLFISTITVLSSVSAKAQSGIASVYSNEKTANGEYAHAGRLTAAHRTLPFGTRVLVTNVSSGRSVVQRTCANGQRVWKLQPDGRATGLGMSPRTAV